jgi:large subunit ribosomal protein L21
MGIGSPDLYFRGQKACQAAVDFVTEFDYKFLFGDFFLMTYAVIRTGGKQYRVSEGDVVRVERLPGQTGDKVTVDDILLVGGNGEVKIGTPRLANAKVTGEIIGQGRAKKILVFKKKRRKSYSRKRGHRQELTMLKITEIQA